MAININRYVDIISTIGAGINAPTRELVGRFFTTNLRVPPDIFVSFTTAAQVGAYFGLLSEEYSRSVFYFSWVSKNLTQPGSIQFARWVDTDIAPMIFSVNDNLTELTNWTSIADGAFKLTIGGTLNTFTGLNFTAAASLAAVATIIETAINGATGTMWTNATVEYSDGGFIFTGGDETADDIIVQASGTGTDITITGLLGWLPGAVFNANTGAYIAGSIWTAGSLEQTLTDLLNGSVSDSNNFGSLAFLNNIGLNITQITEIANWNNGQDNMYLYSVPVLAADVSAYYTALSDIGGVGLTLIPNAIVQNGELTTSSQTVTGLTNANLVLKVGMPVSGTGIPTGAVIQSITDSETIVLSLAATATATNALTFDTVEYQEQIPMMIEAATDYSASNTVQNYMYQVNFSGISPTVSSDALADTMDAASVNYYGSTQNAGTILNFYQRGVLMGLSSDPLDMNTYVNEIWLKDASTAAIMNLFLILTQIPANAQGRSQLLTALQAVINQALNNGTISVNKALTDAQKMFITQATGDDKAWYQVQNIGYWVDCEIVAAGLPPVYTANYILIYSKDDIIRKVTGADVLI